MSKYNVPGIQAQAPAMRATSVFATANQPTGFTHEGALGWQRTAKTEIYLRATSSFMGGEASFYESGQQRDDRAIELIRKLAVEDFDWTFGFLRWLRSDGNMRTAPIVLGAEAVHARLATGQHGTSETAGIGASNRALVDAVCQRADEPGEFLAYWLARFGKTIPKCVKRGLGDAVRRLYTGKAVLKYDTDSHGVRFADVLELCHPAPRDASIVADQAERVIIRDVKTCPRPKKRRFHDKIAAQNHADSATKNLPSKPALRPYVCECSWYHVTKKPAGVRMLGEVDTRPYRAPISWQGVLFKHLIDRRHNRPGEIPAELKTLTANAALRQAVADGDVSGLTNPETLRLAGMTWEAALSLGGKNIDKAAFWSAMIPSMGVMAQIRNARNFDESGVSDEAVMPVLANLVNPETVATSRQLPFRFYSAYKHAPSLRWGHALEIALGYSLPNIPELPGRTLVLVDTSNSMTNALSVKSKVTAITAAAVFGGALALKNPGRVDLYQYADYAARIPVTAGGSLLRLIQAVEGSTNSVGWGTQIEYSLRSAYDGHDRAIIITDGQGCGNGRVRSETVGTCVPANRPVYLFNVEAHTMSPMPTGGAARFDLGGLTDATFGQILQLERGAAGTWPWMTSA